MNKLIGLALVVMFGLTGCGEEKINSKSFYVGHEAERIEKLKDCEEYTNKQLEPNCINAHQARSQINKDIMNRDGIKIDYSSLEK